MESAATLSLEESHSRCLDSNEAFLCLFLFRMPRPNVRVQILAMCVAGMGGL